MNDVAKQSRSDHRFVIPGHIDAALVYDYDLLGGMGSTTDPHELLLAAKREAPPIFYTPRNGGHWVATGLDEVTAISMDTGLFSNTHQTFPHRELSKEELASEKAWLIPNGIDPPLHTVYRKLLNPFFAPAAVKGMHDDMRKHVVRLIEDVKSAGLNEYDFIEKFGMPVPVLSFMDLLGLPRERYTEFVSWSDAYYRAKTPEGQAEAIAVVDAFLDELVKERQANPGDDLMSSAVHLEIDGKPLRSDVLHSLAFNLFLAGLDSVTASCSFVTKELAEDRARQDAMRADPSKISKALEEFFFTHTIACVPRRITRDEDFRGVPLKRNDTIIMANAVAAMDEPDTDKRIQHVAFGVGPHFCIGMFMAKAEMQIFFEEWMTRMPPFELQADKPVTFRSGVVFSLEHLPIRHV